MYREDVDGHLVAAVIMMKDLQKAIMKEPTGTIFVDTKPGVLRYIAIHRGVFPQIETLQDIFGDDVLARIMGRRIIISDSIPPGDSNPFRITVIPLTH